MRNKQKQGVSRQQKIPQNAVAEIKRHFDVVAEKLDDKISAVAEQYGDIKKDVHGIKKDIVGIKETLDSHSAKLDSHSAKLDSHSAKLDSHTEMIGSVKEDVEIIKTDIEFIKGSLKKKVDYEEFAALERRISLVETKLRR